jgi:Domain of unknown function (DUF4333)
MGRPAPGARVTSFASVIAIAACASLLGCGSSTSTLNTTALGHAIERSILTQRHVHAHVSCPKGLPRKQGFAFTCTAALDVGTYPVHVTETNGAGRVRYQNSAPLVALDIAQVQRAIRQSIGGQRHLSATVACPAEVIQRTGVKFTCVATVGKRRYPFAVTEVDGRGHVRYVGLPQTG